MSGKKVDKFLLQNAKFRALRQSVNQEMNGAGIYCIVNKINDHKYIGQSVSIIKRKRDHIHGLRANTHCNPYLQNAWNCYGEQSFTFVVLEYCETKELDEREQYWIDEIQPVYNIAKDVRLWREYYASDNMPDGCYVKQGETFIRPLWHLWVYGGQKSLKG